MKFGLSGADWRPEYILRVWAVKGGREINRPRAKDDDPSIRKKEISPCTTCENKGAGIVLRRTLGNDFPPDRRTYEFIYVYGRTCRTYRRICNYIVSARVTRPVDLHIVIITPVRNANGAKPSCVRSPDVRGGSMRVFSGRDKRSVLAVDRSRNRPKAAWTPKVVYASVNGFRQTSGNRKISIRSWGENLVRPGNHLRDADEHGYQSQTI